MIAYYGATLTPNIDRSPEGYLICRNVPINRTGIQMYSAGELGLEGDLDREVKVYRLEEDVFAPAAMASFEGKDVTRGHPPEMLTVGNQAHYSKGHLENVRRVGNTTAADLMIKDPSLVNDVENGILREISCGYTCTYEPYLDGYKQTHIIGNHVAVVPKGRAGREVAIQDSAPKAEKERINMSKFTHGILSVFGKAAKDASPEELEKMVETAVTALDAEPAPQAQEAAPAEDKAEDEMVEKAPEGDDIGSKLDRILEMLMTKSRGGEGEHRLHDEGDLDEMIEKLSGEKKEDEPLVIQPEDADGCAARDAAVQLLKKVRPAVAAIEDKNTRAKVTDALLSAIKGDDMLGAITKAAQDSAMAAAKKTSKTTYEQACGESASAYASRNPHIKKEG
jgi:hypothetical protein